MISASLRTVAKLLGAGILLASLAFLYRAFESRLADVATLFAERPSIWIVVIAAAVAYAASLYLLAAAWALLLSPHKLAIARSHILVYGLTSIGKYLPFGVFHIGGRHAFQQTLGARQAEILNANIWELALSAGAGAVVGLVLSAPVYGAGVAAVIGAAMFAAPRRTKSVAVAACIVILFMAVMAGLAVVMARSLGVEAPSAGVGGAYLLAWCAGMVTPVAPAGIGVREATFALLTGRSLTTVEAGGVAATMRVVTTLGDFIFFASALALGGRAFLSRAKKSATAPLENGVAAAAANGK